MAFALKKTSVAYAATTLGASMMNAVFGFYYVKIFLNYYHVSPGWFQASQVSKYVNHTNATFSFIWK